MKKHLVFILAALLLSSCASSRNSLPTSPCACTPFYDSGEWLA